MNGAQEPTEIRQVGRFQIHYWPDRYQQATVWLEGQVLKFCRTMTEAEDYVKTVEHLRRVSGVRIAGGRI